MLGKKMFVSIVAIMACIGSAFAATGVKSTGGARAGTLRVQPGAIGARSVSSSAPATVSNEPTRMATLAGLNNLGAKPKLPSGASAAAVADLQDKLSELSADVDALRNAGVDEGAVRDILDSELANKNYATVPYVDDADSAKLAKDEFESKFDTRADEKKLINEIEMKNYALDKNVSFSKDDTHIIMTDGNGVTKNVALLSDLKGDKGDRGEKGEDGSVDAAELERVVTEKIVEQDLPSKEFLSDKYVTRETYTANKTETDNKINAAQLAAENAGTAASGAGSKADAALLAAQNAQNAADGKLSKERADELYADKNFSYSKDDVDEKIRNASSGFDEDRVSELITQAVDGAGFAKGADLDTLAGRVGVNETNITGLQNNKADKSTVYTKGEVDSAISGATSGLATGADLATLAGRVGANETNITGLQENKADKSALDEYAKSTDLGEYAKTTDLGEYAKKGEVLSTGGEFVREGDTIYFVDGDTRITVIEDVEAIRGVKGDKGDKGDDGATPCPGGIHLETLEETSESTTYRLACDDGMAQ